MYNSVRNSPFPREHREALMAIDTELGYVDHVLSKPPTELVFRDIVMTTVPELLIRRRWHSRILEEMTGETW